MSDKGSDSEEYEVDEIVDKRIHKGQTQYLVQWVGYSAGDCTWEPAVNLSCPEKIHEFEEERLREAKNEKAKSKPKEGREEASGRENKRRADLSAHRHNFDNDVKPQTFTGIIKIDEELHAIVKFKDVDDVEMVPIKDLKKKWPQMLIHFLEKKLVYKQDEEADGNESSNSDGMSNGGSVRDEPSSPVPGPSGVQKPERQEQRMDYSDSD